jgi:hypothetical protein
MRIQGLHLTNGKNRVIIELDRPLTPGEEVYNTLTDGGGGGRRIVVEEERECKCIHKADCNHLDDAY